MTSSSRDHQSIRPLLILMVTAFGVGAAIPRIMSMAEPLSTDQAIPFGLIGAALLIIAYHAIFRYPLLDIFSPSVAFPFVLLLYFGIGLQNISTLRGVISSRVLVIPLAMAVIGYFMGLQIARMGRRAVRSSFRIVWSAKQVRATVIPLSAIGLLSIAVILSQYGVPLLLGAGESGILIRASVSPTKIYLSRLAWISGIIYVAWLIDARPKLKPTNLILPTISFAGLALLGYRSLMLLPGVSLLVILYYKHKLSWRHLLTAGLTLLVASYGLWYARYMVEGAYDPGDLPEMYDFALKNGLIFYLYRIAREGVDLASKAIAVGESAGFLRGRLLIADLVTLLPGSQISGGGMVSKMLGGTGRAGLTPTVVGALYLDWGNLGVLFGLLAIGFIICIAYRRMRESWSISSVLIYSVILASSLHYLHRGVFAASYIWDISILVIAAKYLDRTGKQVFADMPSYPGASRSGPKLQLTKKSLNFAKGSSRQASDAQNGIF